jgi:hypothetical protein
MRACSENPAGGNSAIRGGLMLRAIWGRARTIHKPCADGHVCSVHPPSNMHEQKCSRTCSSDSPRMEMFTNLACQIPDGCWPSFAASVRHAKIGFSPFRHAARWILRYSPSARETGPACIVELLRELLRSAPQSGMLAIHGSLAWRTSSIQRPLSIEICRVELHLVKLKHRASMLSGRIGRVRPASTLQIWTRFSASSSTTKTI